MESFSAVFNSVLNAATGGGNRTRFSPTSSTASNSAESFENRQGTASSSGYSFRFTSGQSRENVQGLPRPRPNYTTTNSNFNRNTSGSTSDPFIRSNTSYARTTTRNSPPSNPNPTSRPTTSLSHDDRSQGEQLKVLGNRAFSSNDFQLAVDYYTKAIAADDSRSVYFTNRALCFKRLNEWTRALEDAEQALRLDDANVKGLYYKGEALMHIGKTDDALVTLQRALRLADGSNKRMALEAEETILKCKKQNYLEQEHLRSEDRNDLMEFLKKSIVKLGELGEISQEDVPQRLTQLEKFASEAEYERAPFEVPNFLNCKISMGLMKDPVISPSGITYEKAMLVEHLQRNGPSDPVTRNSCDVSQLFPNFALKEASEWFLKKYPWAYDA